MSEAHNEKCLAKKPHFEIPKKPDDTLPATIKNTMYWLADILKKTVPNP